MQTASDVAPKVVEFLFGGVRELVKALLKWFWNLSLGGQLLTLLFAVPATYVAFSALGQEMPNAQLPGLIVIGLFVVMLAALLFRSRS